MRKKRKSISLTPETYKQLRKIYDKKIAGQRYWESFDDLIGMMCFLWRAPSRDDIYYILHEDRICTLRDDLKDALRRLEEEIKIRRNREERE